MLVAETQTAYDTTVAANLQPTIIAALKEVSKFPWINVTYSLANGSSCLLWCARFGQQLFPDVLLKTDNNAMD